MDVSTPPSQTPTLNLTAMTLRGSASMSTGPWLPPTTRRTPPPVLELPQEGKIPRHVGMMGK